MTTTSSEKLHASVRTMQTTDLLLQAACGIDGPFTAEDLTVAAFRLCQEAGRDPNPIALKGHPEYPNHHVVYYRLCGRSRGLVCEGLMDRNVRARSYAITQRGRERAEASVREGLSKHPKWRRETMATLHAVERERRVEPSELPTDEEIELHKNRKHEAYLRWMKRQESFGRIVSGRDAYQAFEAVVIEVRTHE